MRALAVVLQLTLTLCAQDVSVPMRGYDDISYPNYRYAEKVSSLRDLNFRNLRVFWFPREENDNGAKLRNGRFQRKWNAGYRAYEEVRVDLVEFLGSGQTGKRSAVIDLEWWDCGGSCTHVGRIQVFELQAGHPTVIEEIEYDHNAPGTGVHYDSGTQILTVTGRSNDDSANCCPKSVDIMKFAWDGRKFVFSEGKTVPVTDADPGTIVTHSGW